MPITLSKWTLEVQGADDSYDFYKDELQYRKKAMKSIMYLISTFCLYDIIYFYLMNYNDFELNTAITYMILSDIFPVILFCFFFIVLPRKNIIFNGIGAIPIFIYVVIQLELSAMFYDFDQISS